LSPSLGLILAIDDRMENFSGSISYMSQTLSTQRTLNVSVQIVTNRGLIKKIFRVTGFFQVIRRKETTRFLPQHPLETIQFTVKVGDILSAETLEHLPDTRHKPPLPSPKTIFKSKLPPLSYLTACLPARLTNLLDYYLHGAESFLRS
jgi:hypothetical protein